MTELGPPTELTRQQPSTTPCLMSDSAADEDTMASLNAAKHQLRAAMKHKLRAVSHDSIVSQSTGLRLTEPLLSPETPLSMHRQAPPSTARSRPSAPT